MDVQNEGSGWSDGTPAVTPVRMDD